MYRPITPQRHDPLAAGLFGEVCGAPHHNQMRLPDPDAFAGWFTSGHVGMKAANCDLPDPEAFARFFVDSVPCSTAHDVRERLNRLHLVA